MTSWLTCVSVAQVKRGPRYSHFSVTDASPKSWPADGRRGPPHPTPRLGQFRLKVQANYFSVSISSKTNENQQKISRFTFFMKKSNWSDWIYKVFKVIDELISVELFHPSLRVSSTRSAATGRDSQSTPKRRPASRMQMSRPRWPFWRNSHSGGASCFRMTTNSPLPIPAVWSNLPTKKKNTTIPLNFIQLHLFGFNSIQSDLIRFIFIIFFWFNLI